METEDKKPRIGILKFVGINLAISYFFILIFAFLRPHSSDLDITPIFLFYELVGAVYMTIYTFLLGNYALITETKLFFFRDDERGYILYGCLVLAMCIIFLAIKYRHKYISYPAMIFACLCWWFTSFVACIAFSSIIL